MSNNDLKIQRKCSEMLGLEPAVIGPMGAVNIW